MGKLTEIKMKTILVTGAGAVLGQGILRSLNQASNKYLIHTADPDWRSAGHWLGNKAHTIPMANDSNYFNIVEKIIDREKIDAVLIGTDVELPLFAKEKNRLNKNYGDRKSVV